MASKRRVLCVEKKACYVYKKKCAISRKRSVLYLENEVCFIQKKECAISRKRSVLYLELGGRHVKKNGRTTPRKRGVLHLGKGAYYTQEKGRTTPRKRGVKRWNSLLMLYCHIPILKKKNRKFNIKYFRTCMTYLMGIVDFLALIVLLVKTNSGILTSCINENYEIIYG